MIPFFHKPFLVNKKRTARVPRAALVRGNGLCYLTSLYSGVERIFKILPNRLKLIEDKKGATRRNAGGAENQHVWHNYNTGGRNETSKTLQTGIGEAPMDKRNFNFR